MIRTSRANPLQKSLICLTVLKKFQHPGRILTEPSGQIFQKARYDPGVLSEICLFSRPNLNCCKIGTQSLLDIVFIEL